MPTHGSCRRSRSRPIQLWAYKKAKNLRAPEYIQHSVPDPIWCEIRQHRAQLGVGPIASPPLAREVVVVVMVARTAYGRQRNVTVPVINCDTRTRHEATSSPQAPEQQRTVCSNNRHYTSRDVPRSKQRGAHDCLLISRTVNKHRRGRSDYGVPSSNDQVRSRPTVF